MPATWMRTPSGGTDAGGRAVEVRRRHHHAPGHHAVGEHLADAVHVGEEELERPDPLTDPALDVVPLLGVDHPRHRGRAGTAAPPPTGRTSHRRRRRRSASRSARADISSSDSPLTAARTSAYGARARPARETASSHYPIPGINDR